MCEQVLAGLSKIGEQKFISIYFKFLLKFISAHMLDSSIKGFLIKFVFVRVGMRLIIWYPTIHNVVAAFLILNKKRVTESTVLLFIFGRIGYKLFHYSVCQQILLIYLYKYITFLRIPASRNILYSCMTIFRTVAALHLIWLVGWLVVG